MINEEITKRTLSLEVQGAKLTVKILTDLLKKLLSEAKKHGGLAEIIGLKGNEVKLKEMVKKGQLEDINVKDVELKELKKELNKYGVKFSVMKDIKTGNNIVFFQAKDTKILDFAFKKVLSNLESKQEHKNSVHKDIAKFKEMAKNITSKDKVKHKHKEQSR